MNRPAIYSAVAPSVAIIAFLATTASAQPRDMAPSCVEQDRELAQTRRELKSTNEKLNRLDAERSNLKEELASKAARLGECQSDTQACVTAKSNLCAATGELVDDVLRGDAVDAAVGACVSAPKQGALESLLRGWRATTASLAAMASFASGESDLPMRQLAPPGSALPAERLAQRIYAPLRGAPPLFYRRLLIDAARAVAPRAWRRLQLGGSAGLDAWFSSAAPLDRSFLDEAQSRLRANGQGDDASALAQALDLVHAYQELVGCDSRPSALRGCARAESLQQLLETSGPLLVRRRLQSVWSTECSSIDPGAVTHWLVEFPAAAAAQKSEWHDVYEAVVGKLYTCYLAEDEAPPTYGAWFDKRLPHVDQLSEATAKRVDAIRQLQATLGPSYNRCATAARALRNLRAPSSCRLPAEALQPLASWTNDPQFSRTAESPIALRACVDQVHLLWEGKVASTPTAFAHPPSPSQLVAVRFAGPESPVARLRARCDARTFESATMSSDSEALGKLAGAFGERASDAPWQLDENSNPIELGHYRGGQDWRTWGLHVAGRTTACGVLQLEDERCKVCGKLTGQALDCSLVARLQTDWQSRDRRLIAALAIVAAFFFLLLWARRLRFALRRWRGWSERLSGQLAALAMDVRRRRWARLVPSAWRQLHVDLPHTPAWERWGRRAVVFGANSSADGDVDRKEREQVSERDVHQAALAAQAIGAEIALLIHAEGSTPTLAAVRALLDWAARPGKRGVHVLCVSLDRLKWARTSDDLLELVEDSSLRGNPFEVRGRLTSSGQFWNRERLVSGLLASAEAGRWVVVTGLRRMGKSSLALEVARRLPGPSAYVDLAGFHYEMARALDAAGAADAILRYVCLQLHSGARQRFGDRVTLPEPRPANTPLDAATLGQWLVQFSAVAAEQRSGAILIILDELEQALGVGPDQLPHSLLTLSTVVGRLRNALVTPLMSGRGPRIGLFVCSALHPILWAPLATLGHQSLMGAFESVCVPRLPVEAAQAMMRSLGMRQGIRFTDEALQLLVGEAQGIALLVRRLGSSVLELYDAERARQGQLGSVEIGIEGARAAVRREQDEGAPLRVWIESEIADASPAGQLLRRLANAKDARLPTAELRRLAQESILAQFAVTGLDQELTAEENQRRAAEAAGVLVRMLGESGLVELEGAEIDPDAYRLPNGLVRQILATNRLAKSA